MRPEHKFPASYDEWSQSVIDNAAYFTVVTFLGYADRENYIDKKKFDTLEEAVTIARPQARSLVYAVTESGRSTTVPPSKWPSPTDT